MKVNNEPNLPAVILSAAKNLIIFAFFLFDKFAKL